MNEAVYIQAKPTQIPKALNMESKPTEVCYKVPWGAIRGKAWNSPTGRPLLCVHGASHNANSFDRLVPFLPKDLYIIAIDIPGHGLSDHLPSKVPYYNIMALVGLKAVVEDHKWETVTLMGHCAGGLIAFQYAMVYPERVASIIALDSPCFFDHESVSELLKKVNVKGSPSFSIQSRVHIDQFYKEQMKQVEKSRNLYTREGAIESIIEQAFQFLPRSVAELLFDRAFQPVEGGKYRYRRDPRIGYSCFDVGFLGGEAELQARLKDCNWTLLIIKALDGPFKSTFEANIALFKRFMPSKFNNVVVPGNHQNHMVTPQHAANHILRFLGNFQSKL